jgi:transcriptional regulator GlxA family with amidase domain
MQRTSNGRFLPFPVVLQKDRERRGSIFWMKKRESKAAFPTQTRRIVFLATPNAQALEVAGPIEVFAMAERKLLEAGRGKTPAYTIDIASAVDDVTVRSPSGLGLLAQHPFHEITGPIDTLLVAGGLDLWAAHEHPRLIAWLKDIAPGTRRIASVCTGAFVLAEAGLLDGCRVTTHWYFAQQLKDRFPKLTVDPEPIFIRDGFISTSAGVTAGLDLALSMVEEDLGMDIALRVARALVLFLRRSEGQSQFSTSLAFQTRSRLPLREIPIFILENLASQLSVGVLASRVAMSPRNFARVFRQEYGETPALFVERLRVETAAGLLKESDLSQDEIAQRCGFSDAGALRRSFKKMRSQAPSKIRNSDRLRPSA